MITSSNLDYLIPPVRLHLGDPSGSIFSDTVILTGLVFGVKMLQTRWSNRYFIYTSDMHVSGTLINTPNGQFDIGYTPNVNDALRNPFIPFVSTSPPIIDQNDEPAIVLAAAILVRKSAITSSVSAFSSWSTPDLSVSNIQSGKVLVDMLRNDEEALNELFKRRLGKSVKDTFPLGMYTDLTPYVQDTQVIPLVTVTSDKVF